MNRLAYVVSSHGFGHAARACAVIEALWEIEPMLEVEIFTGTPAWFFDQSLTQRPDDGTSCGSRPSRDSRPSRPYQVHHAVTDVGLHQTSALREDVDATRRALDALLPIAEASRALEEQLAAAAPDLVVADISPWGLDAARRLALPTVLIENFTWDWIYAGYPELAAYVAPFADAFASAGLHIQAEPICRPAPGSIRLPPISRRARRDVESTRRRLGVALDAELVMVTMGGVEWRFDVLDALHDSAHTADGRPRVWLVAGGTSHRGAGPGPADRRGNVVLLPHRSEHYHPDLVAASDLVVAKLGYSTLAEVVSAGARLAYVPRPAFPESPPLERWTRRNLASRRVEPRDMEAADWAARIVRHVDALSAAPSSASAASSERRAEEEAGERVEEEGAVEGPVEDPAGGAGQAAEAILRFARSPTRARKAGA